MKRVKAIEIIQNLNDKSDESSLEAYMHVLEFLENSTEAQTDLQRLYLALTRPGGIECEVIQNRMLAYLDEIDQKELAAQEIKELVAHLSSCIACGKEYLELSAVRTELLIGERLAGIPAKWRSQVQKTIDNLKNLKFLVSLTPLYQPPSYGYRHNVSRELADKTDLYLGTIGSNLPVNVAIKAKRVNDTASYTLSVKIRGEHLVDKLEGHKIVIQVGTETELGQVTNKKGEVIFTNLGLTDLLELNQITVKVQVDVRL